MLTQELIIKRREKQPLSADEIKNFVSGIAPLNQTATVNEAQVAAFCMTVCLNPLSRDERVALTLAMAHSGLTLDWSGESLNGPVLDKHSTGGVGDKVSLMLAPIIAACGGFVPMISGRGLGHTGGTLDKMDAIPGYVSQPDLPTFRKVVKDCGCAIIGATRDLAPADRIMYAVRDVTGTVESLDLITASILSKKMAAGLSGLVMDVKYGSGAFMQNYEDAKALAESIAGVANGGGLPCTAILTDMNRVLGHHAGNAVEVLEAIAFLKNGTIEPRLYDVTLELCGELLTLGKLATDRADGRAKSEAVLKNGKAAEFFARMVHALGGPADLMDAPEKHLKVAPIKRDVFPAQAGTLKAMNVREFGYAVIELGGGRRIASDNIDHSVGLLNVAALGTPVGPGGQPVCTIAGRDDASVARAEALILAAISVK